MLLAHIARQLLLEARKAASKFMSADPQLVTLYVLGGAYKGNRRDLKILLTHTRDLNYPGEVAICGQKNIADEYSSSSEDQAKPPTCPKCLSKDPRFQK